MIVRAEEGGFALEVHETLPYTDNDFGIVHNQGRALLRLISARGNGRDIAQCERSNDGQLACWMDVLAQDGGVRMSFADGGDFGFLPIDFSVTSQWVRRHSIGADRDDRTFTYEIGVRGPIPDVWPLSLQDDGTLHLASPEDADNFINRIGAGEDGAVLVVYQVSRSLASAQTFEILGGQLTSEMQMAQAFFQLVAGGYD